MKPEINFMIHDWMYKRLELKGASLFLCGFMFAARQKLGGEWRSSSELTEAFPYSDATIFVSLNHLFDLNVLRRRKKTVKNRIFFEYRFNEDYVFDIVFLKDKLIE